MRKIVLLIMLTSVALIWAQYTLSWFAVTNGGTEFPNGRLTSGYKLADNIGNSGSASDTVLTDGSSFMLYPGYRYVDLDLRKPFSSIDSTDTISHSPSFVISWTGEDTTVEDGEGWGIRYYDVDYAVNNPSAWNSWFTGVTFTSAVFGPSSPVSVQPDSIYYFRVKAYDLATNVEDDHSTYDQKVAYKPITLAYRVYNPYSDTAIWAPSDTYDVGNTVSMENSDVLIVKNLSTDSIELALDAYSSAIDTSTGQPYWSLDDNPGKDQFALRAHFSDDATPPTTYTSSDAVRDTFLWAKDGWFGGPTHGYLAPNDGIPAHDSTQYTENLWMQVILPTSITQHGDTVVYKFMVNLKGMSAAR